MTNPLATGRIVEFADGDAADKLLLFGPHYLFSKEIHVRKLVKERRPDDTFTEMIKNASRLMDRKRVK